jgi:uncharacterized protein YqiB (DUF1249 family)
VRNHDSDCTAMLADSLLLPQCVYRPGSFSGLMLLYESNYHKLMQLIGEIGPAKSGWISRVRNDSDLHIEWLETEPYTSTLRMTYWLRGGIAQETPEPNLIVRIYHDAAQVEALAGDNPHECTVPEPRALLRGGELARRWQRNMMLNKWLDYLLDRGHGFA